MAWLWTAATACASGLGYVDYETAKRVAAESGRLIMIEATSPHCRYCKKMELTTLADPEVADTIRRRFVPVRIDVSRQELPEGLGWQITPTFFFLDARGRLIKTIPGAWGREDFLDLMEKIGRSGR
jgi:thioredoxin-related protein